MTEAIATTKRKFYKALDSLGNQPPKRARRDISTTSITSLQPTRVEAVVEKKDLPNFAPWSHEAFLARLKTFSSVSLWHPKPEEISEVEWAKRGWVCVDVNTVGCRGGCERRVVVDMASVAKKMDADDGSDGDERDPDELEQDQEAFEAMLAERYKALIPEGHAENCLWRQDGCKDDIYHVQVIRPKVWQPELRTRYLSLLDIADSIRDVNTIPLEHNTSNVLPLDRVWQELSKQLLSPPSDPPVPELSTKAIEFALHGWRGSSDTGNDLLHCDTCFQRVGLWMYQPGYKSTHAASSSPEPQEAGSSTINLAETHREYCPWRNPTSQKAAGTLSGMNASEILQRVVSTYAREQRRKSDQQTRDVNHVEESDGDDGVEADVISLSRTEIDEQDKERESRIQRLKRLLTIKKRPKGKATTILPVNSRK
ncbi:Hypothetical protein R9X50_00178100 [Acrodontium crateriforme]|uniref:Zf-C3HC-domain-containing protein n=1 Tax=Acrodontium crateriforme TaxID=150365 RepID=A0AAQ3R8G9_9PEZI|nr:Hypothetical protein R9X50_00178100 [Acrodontium crateriforme]